MTKEQYGMCKVCKAPLTKYERVVGVCYSCQKNGHKA